MAEREVQRLAKILGNSIVERRKILGMTQIELANRLDMAPDALSRIENGYVAPRFNRIEEMAKVLECSVAELFREKNDSLKTRSDCIADIITSGRKTGRSNQPRFPFRQYPKKITSCL